MMKQLPVPVLQLSFLFGLLGCGVNVFAQGTGGGNDAMLLLLEQNRNLQAEVQALRALVEEQGYEIRKLQRESLDRYTDTDNRLRNLEQGLAGGGVVAPVSTGGAPAVTSTAPGGNTVAGSGNELPSTSSPAASSAVPARVVESSPSTIGRGTSPVAPSRSTAGGVTSRNINTRSSLEPAVLTEQQLYQMAYDSAINSQFERAIAEFDQYLSIYPQGRFATNSHYWKGQSYLYLRRYDEAIAEYGIILQQYPSDAKVPDSMYGQATAYEGMGDVQRARQLLQQIMRDFPNTGVANLADTRLRSLN